jgi:transcription antitermination factor NusG
MEKRTDSRRLLWYVLYTAPRAEKQVEQRINKLQADVETYLPLHQSLRRWSDRVKTVEVPLFPSYLFVRTTDALVRTLTYVQGVSRIVFFEGRPAVMRASEIESIRRFLAKAAGGDITYDIGDDVLIACGPLKDISGRIKRIGKNRFLLHLEQLQITVSVTKDQVMKKGL